MAAEGGQNSKSRPCNPYWLQALANDREDVERLLLEGGGSTKSLQQCLGLLKQLKADHGAGMHMQAWGGEYEGPISVCEVLIAASGGDWEAVLQLPGTGSRLLPDPGMAYIPSPELFLLAMQIGAHVATASPWIPDSSFRVLAVLPGTSGRSAAATGDSPAWSTLTSAGGHGLRKLSRLSRPLLKNSSGVRGMCATG